MGTPLVPKLGIDYISRRCSLSDTLSVDGCFFSLESYSAVLHPTPSSVLANDAIISSGS